MMQIQERVDRLLAADYAGNTEAAIAMFALVRSARVLLQKYPERKRLELLQAVIPFLRGETKPEVDYGPLLVTPDGRPIRPS